MKRFRETRYLISEDGKVYNSERKRFLTQVISNRGYARLILRINKVKVDFRIHRLVAEVYLENPNNYEQVNHKDGNKLNNHVSNLEWCSMSHNIRHAIDTGLMRTPQGIVHGMSKLKESDIAEIKRLYDTKEFTYAKLADKFNVTTSTIYKVMHNITWKHLENV